MVMLHFSFVEENEAVCSNTYVRYVDDYQCQFATDFLQRTQKAFQCSHYMHDVNNDQEWSQGEDHDDHQQPF